jgi:pimeloyl-ACP methyl ester carboxylesterase
MTPHSRRVLKTIVAALFVLVLAGVTYQGVATALERRTFRYPGRMVPVGDHQLHLHCVGKGSPTVVLEAPALGFSESWSLVQPAVARTTRVCAYDRAGLGWSEASDSRFDARLIPEELYALLHGADEQPPFVLVGDGMGAALATLFAATYPRETAALVLLDPPDARAASLEDRARHASASPWLARTGVLRLSRLLEGTATSEQGGAVDAFSLRPDHLTRAGEEVDELGAIVSRANDVALPSELPVRRLESTDDGSLLSTARQATLVVDLLNDVVGDVRHPAAAAEP